MSKTKTGIMGGTFNPIHNGHLFLARTAMEKAGLDEIIWIPNYIAYLKDQSVLVNASHRWNMTELAIQGIPGYSMSDIEIKKGGNSYTHETLKDLNSLYPDKELYFITGADTIYTIESWVNPKEVFERSVVLAAYRSGQSLDELNDQISHLKQKYDARVKLISTKAVDISSTSIREMIKSNKDVSDFLPQKVYDYIKENNLYIKLVFNKEQEHELNQ